MISGLSSQEMIAVLFERFDSCCISERIDYFAINDTLINLVTYHSVFFLDKPTIEVGMLRNEYTLFKRHMANNRIDGLKCIWPNYRDAQYLRIVFTDNDNNTSVTLYPEIHVYVYDRVPNDYDLFQFHFRFVQFLKQIHIGKLDGLASLINRVSSRYNDHDCDYVACISAGKQKRINLVAVNKTRRITLGSHMVSVPTDISDWIDDDRERELQRTSHIQKDLLRIASEIDRVCRKNNISYFACGGTLLGAVRGNCFIPWDDDMDFGMPRSDYERFIGCASSQLDKRFSIQSGLIDEKTPYLYSKVRMNDTEFLTEYTTYRNFNNGISIDVFPFDYVNTKADWFGEFHEKANSLAKEHARLAKHQITVIPGKSESRSCMEVVVHTIMGIRHWISCRQSLRRRYERYHRHVTKYNQSRNMPELASFVVSFTYIRIQDLYPIRRVPFSGIEIPIPNNADAFLRRQYGRYEELPPLHKRHGHRVKRWRTSDGANG